MEQTGNQDQTEMNLDKVRAEETERWIQMGESSSNARELADRFILTLQGRGEEVAQYPPIITEYEKKEELKAWYESFK